jgi:hypothetical protein
MASKQIENVIGYPQEAAWNDLDRAISHETNEQVRLYLSGEEGSTNE